MGAFVYRVDTNTLGGHAIQCGGSDPPKAVVEVNGTTSYAGTEPSIRFNLLKVDL